MITPQMEKLLTYLGNAEGLDFHRNTKESDITSPYGIYKTAHPNAEIFQYLSRVVLAINVPRHTEDWKYDDLIRVNQFLNTSPIVKQEIRQLAANFYTEYYKNANLELIPVEAVVAMASMYTTSPEKSIVSLQRAINECIKNNFISNKLLIDDGDFGNNTKTAAKLILEAREANGVFFGYMFEEKIIRHMTMQYDDLCYADKAKYGWARDGWRNRMNQLAEFQ